MILELLDKLFYKLIDFLLPVGSFFSYDLLFLLDGKDFLALTSKFLTYLLLLSYLVFSSFEI